MLFVYFYQLRQLSRLVELKKNITMANLFCNSDGFVEFDGEEFGGAVGTDSDPV